LSTPRRKTRTPGVAQSSNSTVEVWARASIIRTPGIVGWPGKWPWKNSSLTVTFFAATTRRPGSCWITASSRYQG
jgi:hypothetical protein